MKVVRCADARRAGRWRRATPARLLACLIALAPVAGHAEEPAADDLSLSALATGARAPEGRMLVEAETVIYDIDADRVSAIGNVVIYYGSYTLVAGRVDVDKRTKRVTASGGVEITDEVGNVVRGDSVDLTDDLRDGVVEALEIVTAERTAFSATRARREGGDVTTFEDGVYLPCVDCDGVKGRKPIWQIRANRIVHRQGDKTVTFQDARFEFLGVPLAYVPVLTQPDPTVRRKTGLLVPQPSYQSNRGLGLAMPYFVTIAPNMDVTLSPTVYSRQGLMADAEFRHRIEQGIYTLRLSGLRQERPEDFEETSGNRRWRGSLSSTGNFRINDRWTWGWNLAAATDRSFFEDYDREEGGEDITNEVFLTGVDKRNRFDARIQGFFVQQEDVEGPFAPEQTQNLQEKQPFVHPVIDHQIYADEPVFGGEFQVHTNFTSLSRTSRDVYEFDADGDGFYGPDDPDGERTRLRGAAGSFTRGTVDALWRRRFVDSIGQVFTPFAYVRGDVLFSAPADATQVGLESEELAGRVMPAVGLEYSYPMLVEGALGTHVIEPVAQLIARPNETEVGNFSNEDAQSLVFDATNLFAYDKFSGYDRTEGGTRLNFGLRYTGRLPNGVALTGIVGRSLHLAGRNSFTMNNDYQTGVESGLDADGSDYVAALSLDTTLGVYLNGAARFDANDGSPNRVEGQLVTSAGRLTTAFTYAYIRAQPGLGIEEDRTEIQGAANLHLAEHWRLFGGTRYDLENNVFVRNAVGVGYDDEAFSVSLSYSEDKTRATGDPIDRTIYLRFGLRTLGETGGSFDALR